jgi:hypothetical protein
MMSERMTDERLAEIDFPFAFVSKGELYKALKAEREHWEAEDESMCDHQMRWHLMKNRIKELESCLKEAIDLCDDPDYKNDSFTTQPWKAVLESK